MLACALCFCAAACQPIIIGFAGSTGAIAAFELLAGIGVSAGFTLWETTLGREIPPGALSRVTSLDWFTTAGLMPLGFAAVAAVAATLGTRDDDARGLRGGAGAAGGGAGGGGRAAVAGAAGCRCRVTAPPANVNGAGWGGGSARRVAEPRQSLER